LGKAAWRLIQEIEGRPHAILDSRRRIVALPFRQATKEAIAGKAIGAQRFGGAGVYERDMASVLERISKRPSQPAEVQVHRLGEWYVAAVPCELFAELGFAVKERSHPRHTLIAGWTNGMVGYVPTREALQRGGYETTFADSSRLGPEAGDLLVDAIVAVVREMEVEPPV